MKPKILVAEDEKLMRFALTEWLGSNGYTVQTTDTASGLMRILREKEPSVVILDNVLPDGKGLSYLPKIKELHKDLPVIMITAFGEVKDAVKAMKAGAHDYLVKPLDKDELILLVKRVLETKSLKRRANHHHREMAAQYSFDNIIAVSKSMRQAVNIAKRIAESNFSVVLLLGETGTGKDLLAGAIHFASARAEGPFILINCSALPGALLESELFGYERGAFTDAKKRKEGLLEMAEGGTALLNEIGDLESGLQAKLLHLLDNNSFRRLGGTEDVEVDLKLIAATNRDLPAEVRTGRFREDLYYRLRVSVITLPPLRYRSDDIKPLADHFLKKYRLIMNHEVNGFTDAAFKRLLSHNWSGNVRELRNVIEHAVMLKREGFIDADDLSIEPSFGISIDAFKVGGKLDSLTLDETERIMLRQALKRAHGNKSGAARLLGVSRDKFRYRAKKHGIK